jgi:hypothetical protein
MHCRTNTTEQSIDRIDGFPKFPGEQIDREAMVVSQRQQFSMPCRQTLDTLAHQLHTSLKVFVFRIQFFCDG